MRHLELLFRKSEESGPPLNLKNNGGIIIDEVGVKHNNAMNNVHEDEEKDFKAEHKFYFEL